MHRIENIIHNEILQALNAYEIKLQHRYMNREADITPRDDWFQPNYNRGMGTSGGY